MRNISCVAVPRPTVVRRATSWVSTWVSAVIAAAGIVVTTGCSHLVDLGEPDSRLVSPEIVHSYQGALGLYYGTVGAMAQTGARYAMDTGIFTDELHIGIQGLADGIDARSGNDTTGLSMYFSSLSYIRDQAQQARGALALYPHEASSVMTAELYAIQGLDEVMMTELLCNGFPLATTPYGGDFQYSGAITMHDVLAQAIAHFDSALAMASDSAAIITLASVGKGRALLDLGQFAAAAAAVANVPTSAQYVGTYGTTGGQDNPIYSGTYVFATWYYITSREGTNGIDWNYNDPRIPVTQAQDGVSWIQAKYSQPTTPFVLADGIEARLIEAEAQLQAKKYTAWITTLQTLAQGVPGVPVPTDPGAVNGSDSARVTAQFRERAYWLYLTGHRQGDTRRLARQYDRPPISVIPSGAYLPTDSYYVVYGKDIAIAPPPSERQNNALYHGCLDQHP